jgi:glycosyltransferase involved in cell wall biosynthesis
VLTVIYPAIRTSTGTRRYVDRILKGLNDFNYPHKEIGIRKFEISVGGKPVGGILSQKLGMGLHRRVGHPNHSLAAEVSPRDPDIVTIHDIIPLAEGNDFIKGGYDRSAYRMMYGNAFNAKILLVSTSTGKKEMTERIGIEEYRVRVIYHSIDLTKFFPDPSNPYPDDGKMHLVTVGDFNPRKRFDLLYNIISREKDFHLYHIGPTNSWKDRAEKMKRVADAAGNISIMGQVDDSTLRRYLTNADLFVYISDAEGFGYPPIEAMACGTNVVVNDLEVFRETIGDVATISTVDNFQDSIYKALNKKKESAFLVEYVKKFSLAREISSMIELYDEFERNL